MASISHREFRTRIARLDIIEHEPTPTHFYLMQIAGYAHHAMSEGSSQWQPNNYRLEFKPVVELPESQKLQRSKDRWTARGGPPNARKDT